MRRISATYIFTLQGTPLKKGIVEINDNGIIEAIIDTGGVVTETAGLEYYSGIIVPGFVNIHCNLEQPLHQGEMDKRTGKIHDQTSSGYADLQLSGKLSAGFEIWEIPIPNAAGSSPKETNKEKILLLNCNSTLTEADFAVLNEFRSPHNTFLLANANNFFEKQLPDYSLLQKSGYPICISTVNLATNQLSSILDVMKTIQSRSKIPTGELLQWACRNGARALQIETRAGTIEEGKSPGINLISGIDWDTLFLTPQSKVKKLV
jgi:cytosine/adenosine deaminase-related metal-dependent hydrolase